MSNHPSSLVTEDTCLPGYPFLRGLSLLQIDWVSFSIQKRRCLRVAKETSLSPNGNGDGECMCNTDAKMEKGSPFLS